MSEYSGIHRPAFGAAETVDTSLITPDHGSKDQARAFTNIPLCHTDQTLNSLAALCGLQNGIPLGRELSNEVFGSPNTMTGSEFHAGTLRAFKILGESQYDSYENFMESHGSLSIYKPFVSAATYARAAAKLKSNEVTGLSRLLATCNMTAHRHAYPPRQPPRGRRG